MKTLLLDPKSSVKVLRGERELAEKDVVEFQKGLIPGEWVVLEDTSTKKNYIAYVNPFSEHYFKIKIIKEESDKKYLQKEESVVARETITILLKQAIEKRKIFKNYQQGARLVYGMNDCLPGLIVDQYKKYIFIQINTAGVDRFRTSVKEELANHFPDHQIVFFDNEEYRKAEVLPHHELNEFKEDFFEVVENDLGYRIPSKVMQKIGYYYDHRENRQKLTNLLEKLNLPKKTGLDLFSYVGSWGLHLLKAGVEHVEFVDQANMSETIQENLKLNGFLNRGIFFRQDVFKFLEEKSNEGKRYDVIVSDPPAFTKSEKNKMAAIQGYEKLHAKALKLLKENGLLVVASCTHYVNHEELDRTVQDAAFKCQRKLRLLDIGSQGFDHPIQSLKDKSFYIKYLVYLGE